MVIRLKDVFKSLLVYFSFQNEKKKVYKSCELQYLIKYKIGTEEIITINKTDEN